MKINYQQINGFRVRLDFLLDDKEFDKALAVAYTNKMVADKKVASLGEYMVSDKASELHTDTLEIAVNDAYQKAIEKYELKPVSKPIISIDNSTVGVNKTLKFSIEVDVFPTVTLGQYKELVIDKQRVTVKREEVMSAIQNMLKAKSSFVTVEREATNGDTVVIDFEGSVDGVKFDGGSAKGYSLVLGSKQFIAGFEEQVVGMRAGESRDVKVRFPDDYSADFLKGKDAIFAVRMQEVRQIILPEFNDELVKSLGIDGVTTTKDYYIKVRDELRAKKQAKSEAKFASDCVFAAANNAKIEIPDALIFERVDYKVDKVREQAVAYGMELETYLKYFGYQSEQAFSSSLVGEAEQELISELVLAEIAKVEGLEVTQADIDEYVNKIALETGKEKEEVAKRYDEKTLTPYILNQKAALLIKNSALIKEPETIVLVGSDGEQIKCDVLFTHFSQEFNKNFVVFARPTQGSDDVQDVSAAIYYPDGSQSGRLEEITDEREWALIEQLLSDYEDEA